MEIPTEPIGSIPRPLALIEALRTHGHGDAENPHLESLYDEAIRVLGTAMAAAVLGARS